MIFLWFYAIFRKPECKIIGLWSEYWRNRMIRQDSKLAGLVSPVMTELGYELLGIERGSSGRHGSHVRIYMDKEEGITIRDCETVSSRLRGVLDVAGAFLGNYTLEVSSPGIERVLFTATQFSQYVGRAVSVNLLSLILGRRRVRGNIVSVEMSEEIVVIQEEGTEYRIPLAKIARARLIVTTDEGVLQKI